MQGSTKSISRSNVRNSPTLYASWVSGASGAVPASFRRSRGIRSVTRNSTGNYTVVFERGANDWCDMHVTNAQATPAVAGAVDFMPWGVGDIGGTAKSVTFQMKKGTDGSVADPADGDVIRFSIVPKYSNGYA